LSRIWRKLTAPADGPWGDSADVQLTLLLDKRIFQFRLKPELENTRARAQAAGVIQMKPLLKVAAWNAGVYDLAWNRLAGAGWNLRPTADFMIMRAILCRRARFAAKRSWVAGGERRSCIRPKVLPDQRVFANYQ
jgi:hypothetical protein